MRASRARDTNPDPAVPRPFTQLSSANDETSAKHSSGMTLAGLGDPYVSGGYVGDAKQASRGWPIFGDVQQDDVAPSVIASHDEFEVQSGTGSFISPPLSEAPSYMNRPLLRAVPEEGQLQIDRMSVVSPIYSPAVASPDSAAPMFGSRFSSPPSTRFSSSTGMSLSSSSRDPHRDHDLEQLHSAMQRAGLDVQTLLSSLQARPVLENERDVRPPEYGA
jgi:hypothetical protein